MTGAGVLDQRLVLLSHPVDDQRSDNSDGKRQRLHVRAGYGDDRRRHDEAIDSGSRPDGVGTRT